MLQWLQHLGPGVVAAPRLVAVVLGLSCFEACGIFWIRDQTCVSCFDRHILYHWATRKALFVNYCVTISYLCDELNLLCPFLRCMAPHSSTLAWKIPWMEEPGRLQSVGSLRVGYDWASSLSLFTFLHWRRKWQPTPVFLPGESQGRGSLVGCRLWGHTKSDMTEVT